MLANIYLHYALDLWFDRVVKSHCKGEAILCRYADDWVCAFRYKQDAERFFHDPAEAVAEIQSERGTDKAMLRFSRFHPGRERRFIFWGLNFSGFPTGRDAAWCGGQPANLKRP